MTVMRDTPCHCGWKFPGFHVCADLTGPEPVIVGKRKRKPRRDGVAAAKRGSEQWKSNISEARLGQTGDRDTKVLELYSEGFTMRQVGEQVGLDHRTVSKILKNAEARDGIKRRRPRGPARTSTRRRRGRAE